MIYRHDKIPTAKGFDDALITLYLHENSKEIEINRKRPIFILLPGGGYSFLSDREGEPVALALMARGYHACVLRYSVAPAVFPNQLLQLLRTIHYLREKANEFAIDEKKIILMGFSAGGHLAASGALFWSKPYYAGLLGTDPDQLRPSALVLCYPVISAFDFAHESSINNLTGEKKEMYRETVSLDRQVNSLVPPCFIWHTASDSTVPLENSLMFFSALRKCGISAELHIFPKGGHGLSLANEEVYPRKDKNINERVQIWIDLVDGWVKEL